MALHIRELIMLLFGIICVIVIFGISIPVINFATDEDRGTVQTCVSNFATLQRHGSINPDLLANPDVNCPIDFITVSRRDLRSTDPFEHLYVRSGAPNPPLRSSLDAIVVEEMNRCFQKIGSGRMKLFSNNAIIGSGFLNAYKNYCVICSFIDVDEDVLREDLSRGRPRPMDSREDYGDLNRRFISAIEEQSLGFVYPEFDPSKRTVVLFSTMNFDKPHKFGEIFQNTFFQPNVVQKLKVFSLGTIQSIADSVSPFAVGDDIKDVQAIMALDYSDPYALTEFCDVIANVRNII